MSQALRRTSVSHELSKLRRLSVDIGRRFRRRFHQVLAVDCHEHSENFTKWYVRFTGSNLVQLILMFTFILSQLHAKIGQSAGHSARFRKSAWSTVSSRLHFVLISCLSDTFSSSFRHQLQHYTNQLAKDTNGNLKDLSFLPQPTIISEQVIVNKHILFASLTINRVIHSNRNNAVCFAID